MSEKSKTLGNFISQIKNVGLSKSSRYEVTFASPKSLANNKFFANSKLSDYVLLCDRAELPGTSFSTVDVTPYGESREIATNRIYDPLDLTFYADIGLNIKKFFDYWINSIINPISNNHSYYDDYVTDITIIVFDIQGNPRYKVELLEVFPKNIGSISLSYDDPNIMRIPVTIIYRDYRIYDYLLDMPIETIDPSLPALSPSTHEVSGQNSIDPNSGPTGLPKVVPIGATPGTPEIPYSPATPGTPEIPYSPATPATPTIMNTPTYSGTKPTPILSHVSDIGAIDVHQLLVDNFWNIRPTTGLGNTFPENPTVAGYKVIPGRLLLPIQIKLLQTYQKQGILLSDNLNAALNNSIIAGVPSKGDVYINIKTYTDAINMFKGDPVARVSRVPYHYTLSLGVIPGSLINHTIPNIKVSANPDPSDIIPPEYVL